MPRLGESFRVIRKKQMGCKDERENQDDIILGRWQANTDHAGGQTMEFDGATVLLLLIEWWQRQLRGLELSFLSTGMHFSFHQVLDNHKDTIENRLFFEPIPPLQVQ